MTATSASGPADVPGAPQAHRRTVQTETTAIFINQLREKVGVIFGCMTYSTRVTLADGTQEKIGKIVNQRRDVEVLSYDLELGRIVPRRSSTGSTTAGPTASSSSPSPGRGATAGRDSPRPRTISSVHPAGGMRPAS